MAQNPEDRTPFGNPDGSRAHLEQIAEGFISFGSASAWGGLSTPPNDLSARVLVGRKGSGKTLYLRRLQAHAATEASLHADTIQQDHIGTTDVVEFCHWFEGHELNERWKQLWRRAILRSVISHLLCNKKIQRQQSKDLRSRLNEDFPSLRQFKAAVSVYSQASDILHECRGGASLRKYFEDRSWSELEVVVAEALADFPPLCFYIDAVDEEFETAPAYWLFCQKGLFYECMNLLRDPRFGSRLHVVICVRDVVLSSVYHSEHQGRYISEPHIRVLNWNKNSIGHFLDEKIKRLRPEFLAKANSAQGSVESWLGISSIENLERGVEEPIRQYLLRHTRLLPRDIVILGNLLCEEVSLANASPDNSDLPTMIRSTVANAARGFGNEQLAVCANELAASTMLRYAAKYGFESSYIANQEYSLDIIDKVKTLISALERDRFPKEDLEEVQDSAVEWFKNGNGSASVKRDNPWSVLWRNGLLGYVEGRGEAERHIFYSDERIDQFYLPLTAQTYLLHPILIDAVGVSSHGKQPVVPFRNGNGR